MAYEQKDMEGVLFPNDKEGNEARPDHKGNILIKGVEYQVAAWCKVSKNGKHYMSLKAEPMQRKDVSGQVPATQGRGNGSNAPTGQRVGSGRPNATDDRVNQRVQEDNFSDDVPW